MQALLSEELDRLRSLTAVNPLVRTEADSPPGGSQELARAPPDAHPGPARRLAADHHGVAGNRCVAKRPLAMDRRVALRRRWVRPAGSPGAAAPRRPYRPSARRARAERPRPGAASAAPAAVQRTGRRTRTQIARPRVDAEPARQLGQSRVGERGIADHEVNRRRDRAIASDSDPQPPAAGQHARAKHCHPAGEAPGPAAATPGSADLAARTAFTSFTLAAITATSRAADPTSAASISCPRRHLVSSARTPPTKKSASPASTRSVCTQSAVPSGATANWARKP